MDRLDDENRTIAILDIGGVHLSTDQQTAGIGHNVSLAPFDLLGRIVTARPAAFGRLDLGDGIPSDLRGPLIGISDETMSIPSYAYTCAVCEVEVDAETGLVEVVRYASIDDCGRAVNRLLIHGQSHGGIAQGIGQALWEACVYDPQSGQLLSGSFLDYAVPRADLLPAFDTEISEAINDQPSRDARR